MKKNIVVIAGGNSSEYEVSIKSGNHIFSEVDGEKYNKYLMILRGRDWMVEIGDQKFPVDKNDFSFEYRGRKLFLISPISPFMVIPVKTGCCKVISI